MKFITPIIFVLISQSAGIIGSFFTVSSVSTWYQTINKPSFNPPSWIFGPAWITLYTFMGISSYLVWLKLGVNELAKPALILFFIHLAFNAAWSIIFFGLKSPFWALVVIAILWIMIAVLIYMFFQIDRRAAYLMIPYLAWVSFASTLNFFIWRLN